MGEMSAINAILRVNQNYGSERETPSYATDIGVHTPHTYLVV